MAIDTYRDALGYLLSLPDWERGAGPGPVQEALLVERPVALLERMGRPQDRFPSVLVAGTKGKGSTAAMLAGILSASGLRTGLYTQPHLHTYRERVRVDGRLISHADFVAHAARVETSVSALEQERPELESFTTFEATTALALDCFATCGVQVAVLEVGLGGRLDATNTVRAEVSLVTAISRDHTAILGDTLPRIAAEKAAVFKPGKVGLSAPQRPEALAEIERVARERGSALGVAGLDWEWSGDHADCTVETVATSGFWRRQWRHARLQVPLLGAHQLENAASAVAAAEALGGRLNLEIAGDAIRRGLAATSWPGRLEVVRQRDRSGPAVVVDGAHNGDSAEKLVAALRRHFVFERLWLVVAILRDKDAAAIAAPFAGVAAGAWTAQTDHPRSRPADDLASLLRQAGIPAQPAADVREAMAAAAAAASPDDLVCVTGSLSTVAAARRVAGLAADDREDLV